MTVAYLTNSAYGYPRGAQRRIAPRRLLCIHITGNANNLGPSAATNERNYANRPNSGGPSAHVYVNRDGSAVWAIDPVRYAAWSNGDVSSPDLRIPGVEETVALLSKGYNPNEDFVLEVECVGYPAIADITDEQLRSVAVMVNEQARRTGLPITRGTVHTHADYNRVNRANCAFRPSVREEQMRRLIDLANLTPPDTDTEDTMPAFDIIDSEGAALTVKGADHSVVALDDTTKRRAIAEGTRKSGHMKIKLHKPLDGHSGDRQTAWMVQHTIDGISRASFLLAVDVTAVVAPDETPYSQADLDAAKSEAAASATASERKRWTDWKATAPA